MKKFKRFSAFFLSLLMMLTILPINVIAKQSDDKKSVTVYFTISDNGCYLTGNDKNATTMARVPVTVEYFDLADYGLEDYYRCEAESFENGGQYINDNIVEQPTLLHLFIKALEEYYLDSEALILGTDALTVSGSPTTMFMSRFWGHDSNFMYFIDHQYPMMADGFGASADYVLLEDGMEIDVALTSNPYFWMDGYFAYLDPAQETVDVGTTLNFNTMLASAMQCFGYPIPDETAYDMNTVIFDESWNKLADLSDEAAEDGTFSYTFDKPGKYYVTATDKNAGDPEKSCIAPATSIIQVGENGLASVTIESDGNDINLSEQFNKDIFDYTAEVSPSTKSITVYPEAFDSGSIISVNNNTAANDDGSFTIPINSSETKIEIKVSGKSGNIKTYTITITRPTEVNVKINVTPSDAVILLTDDSLNRVLPQSDGSFNLIEGKEYSYVISSYGYKSESGCFKASSDSLNFTLTEAEENSSIDKDISSVWSSFRGNDENNGVTNSKTPKTADEAELYWATKTGNEYGMNAAGSPIIVDDYLIVCAGTELLKINKYTGEVSEQKGEMAATSNFNINPPVYADGMILVGLRNGTIQAFNADTLESLWVYSDPLKGQPNSPLAYKDGYVYTGFWNSETKDANFVCVSTTDEDIDNTNEAKLASWTYKQKGGFYWAGAYVTDNFLLVGTDDGESGYLSDTSSLLSLNPKTGVLIDKIENLNGDIRSSIVYDESTDKYYFSSKGGSFYGVSASSDGKLKELKEIVLTNGTETQSKPAMSTSTPVVYNNRAYIGVSGSASFKQFSGHNITVIDLDSWSVAYTVPTRGYPQASGLLSTAYEDSEGYAYVYFIDNYTPGEIRVIKDKPGITSVVDGVTSVYTDKGVTYTIENCAPVLFTPSGEQAQYSICSPIADENGVLYFKNDSSHIMALGSKIKDIEVTSQPDKTIYSEGECFDSTGMKVTAHLTNGINIDVTDYVSFNNTALTKDSPDVTIYYTHVMYGDKLDAENGNQTNIISDPLETYVNINVLTSDENKALSNVISLIDNIGNITVDSEQAINQARFAYDSLSDNLKPLVSNYSTLLNAEMMFSQLSENEDNIKDNVSDSNDLTSEDKQENIQTQAPPDNSPYSEDNNAADIKEADTDINNNSSNTDNSGGASPNTGGIDENNLLVVLLFLSLGIIITIPLHKKEKKFNNNN